jgi:ABC-type phosphate transport system substrate-binding protein
MYIGRRLFVVLSGGVLSAAMTGCSVENTSTPPVVGGNDAPSVTQDTGRIQIDGSSTVKVITAAIGEEFESKFSDVKIALKVTGTGTGFKEMIAGRIDIANASRPVKDSEKADCEKNGIELLELTVALDGLTVCVNKENDWVDSITVRMLLFLCLAREKNQARLITSRKSSMVRKMQFAKTTARVQMTT